MKLFRAMMVFALLAVATPAYAGESGPAGEGLEHSFSIGAAGIVMPKFEGADSYRAVPCPILEYKNQYFFISTLDGAGVNLLRTETMKAGPLVNYRFERREDDSRLLDGMGNVKGGVEAGAFFNWQFHKRFGTEVRVLHGLDDAKGFTADLALTLNQPITDDLTFALKGAAVYSDSDYNKEYFGITHKQSRRSGYDRYSPGEGIKSVSIQPAISYTVSENYTVGAFYEYKRLTGPAAVSPLVKRGSANQNMTGLTFTWNY